MFQTVTQNSALSENGVGCTPNGPWLRAHCACIAPKPRAWYRVVAHAGSCRGPLLGSVAGAPCRVTARTQALACRVAAFLPAIQKLYRDTVPMSLVLHAHCCACCNAPTTCRRALLRHIAALLHCIVTQRSPAQPRHKILCHDPPLARPCERTLSHALARGPVVPWPVSVVSWRMLNCIVAESWPCRGPCSCAHPSCVTI